jgi:hypothetical protein
VGLECRDLAVFGVVVATRANGRNITGKGGDAADNAAPRAPENMD